MTQKLTLPFFVAIYLISLLTGFGFAGIRQANATTPTYSTYRQSSWILLRVDDMTIEQPRLVSVWAMFLTYSPGPQVFFKPLFSVDAISNKYPELEKVFSVSVDRTVSPDFMKELNRLIPHQSGLIILDNVGYESFTNWFTTPSIAHESQLYPPQAGFSPTKIFQGEIKDYDQICSTLEDTTHPSLVSLPWNELFPNHLVAHPTLQSLTKLWEKLVLSNFDTHCEVIQIQ